MGAGVRWTDWASHRRGPGPLIWIHGASVGEGLTVQPVTDALRHMIPDVQVVYSYTSASAGDWPGPFGADATDFAPADPGATFDALRPVLLMISCADIWPDLLDEATSRGIPVAAIGGGPRESSLRLRWPVRRAFAKLCRHLSFVGATSEKDASLWASLGVAPRAISITGDPRDDRVLLTLPRLQYTAPIRDWARDRRVLVAGSTEAHDDPVLLEALSMLQEGDTRAGLLLVPHDPSEKLSARLVEQADRRGLVAERWDGGPVSRGADVIVAQQKGMLFDLYVRADLAYVGGGFRRRRLHSVLEPAAYAIPTAVGPYASDEQRWAAFIRAGALQPIGRSSAASALSRFWQQPVDSLQHMGLAARAQLSAGAGRTIASALVERFDLAIEV